MTTPATASQLLGRFTDPARPLTFTFEGRTIPAVAGQTVAAALYAAGVRTFSRSFKYHRPRGLLCVAGDCPNCLMEVDGRPNVRTCTEPARQGQVVRGQHAWPGLGFDLLRVFDRLDYFLPVGFYYKRFHKPRWLWPIFEHTVRHVAGLGRIEPHARPDLDAEVEHVHAEVCVIGAGPAGLAAAAAAAEAGADVVLIEREPQPGGHLLYEDDPAGQLAPLLQGVRDRVRLLPETTAFGLYEGNRVGAFRGNRLVKVRAGQVIVATGGRQRPFLFSRNDLPGVFLGRGVLRLARLYGVRAGKRAVVATDCDDGYRLAEHLTALDIEVVAVVDSRPPSGASPASSRRLTVLPGHVVVRAEGGSRLTGVTVAGAGGAEQTLVCDLLCMAPQLTPANELLHQGGMRFTHEGGRWRPSRTVPGLWAAGAAAGTFGVPAQIAEGRQRGQQAAAAAGHGAAPDGQAAGEGETPAAPCESVRRPEALPKCFVCLCEDVTAKDIATAVQEGFDHIETSKRYTTVGMGPCQGKMCGQTATEVTARLTGRAVTTVGTTTSRPPVVPVEMAVLAAERRHHVVRRTPMHHWHAARGARWMDAGLWKRPDSYGDPAAEVRAVRTGVGLIDVSTLGKLDVIGPDAAELLERVYVNAWADLPVGRTRYGVMCTEEGIVFDDGVGARLGPEHFYLTATTGNAEGVFQWLELWRTTWRLDVTVLNQTGALAAVNLAGPRSREVLARLTALDLSPAAFPYSELRQGDVAGVPCRLMRLGFVGELGYEIHCPAAYGLHLWEALMEAGAEFGIVPFGVEAQRILRLEKGHLIVGQDTDALSNPIGAGLGKMVRYAKPFFHGKDALLRFREVGTPARLVGFTLPGGGPRASNDWARRLEGCQVVENGRPAGGRVTSARYSPTLEKYVGLAWVPAARSAAGQCFLVRCDGADVEAQVTPPPFYDPAGARMKS